MLVDRRANQGEGVPMEPGRPDDAGGGVEQIVQQGLELARAGRWQDALVFLEEALQRDPDNTLALRSRATIRARSGELSLAASDLERVLALRPDCADCWYESGRIDLLAGRLDRARERLGRCLRIDPDHAPAYSIRAGLEQKLGHLEQALDDITHALALRPDHPADLHNRAVLLASLGRQAEAIREYEAVLRREPASAGTLNNLAWLLATSRDPALRDCRRAIDCARKAVASLRSGAWLDTLAAAHASCDEFDRAVEIQAEACALAQPPNPAFEKRLALYRRGISYASWLDGQM